MTLESYLDGIQSRTVAVVGIGISNLPLIELLCRSGIQVTACDKRTREELGDTAEKLCSLGAELQLGEDYLDHLHQDIIFRTPGLMPFDPHLEAAKKRGSVVTSEMEVFFSLCPCRIFAVTGSDGKTTTTTIISELLKAAGYTVHLGGNIGKPLLCELPSMRPDDLVVLELSSFQLHSMKCRPHTAVITNISPNHLDKHKDFQDYIDAKCSIFLSQKPDDRLILFADDDHSSYYSALAPSRVSWFSDTKEVRPGCICKEEKILWVSSDGTEEYIMNANEIRIPGQHNVRNYLAAFEAVRGYVSPEICRETAMRFSGVEHRLEEVRTLHGVRYINDSIASSPTRTIAGLRALKTKPIILLGGYDKHLPFDSLGEEVCQRAKAAIVTGDTAERILYAIHTASAGSEFPVYRTENMVESVSLASRIAEAGDTVLLSPACASFDQFRNFEERGNLFKKLVMALE